MSDSPFVPLEEIMRALDLPKRAVYNDIAAGRIPGEFRVTGIKSLHRVPRVKRSEWNKYLAGEEWRSVNRKPVGIVSLGKVS